MDYGFIKLCRPYSFGGPRPKPHLAYPWADPGLNSRTQILDIFNSYLICYFQLVLSMPP
ncbi:hypothetical protein Hanom_Chr06g00576011 [Helianthus anomalus]